MLHRVSIPAFERRLLPKASVCPLQHGTCTASFSCPSITQRLFFLQGAFPLTWISATAFGWVFAEAMKDSILTGMLLDSGSDSIKPLSYHLWTEYTRIRCFVLRHSVQVLPACQKSSTYPSRNQRPNTTGRRRLACTCALFCELAAYTIHQSHLSCSAVSRTCPHVPLLDHGVSVLTVTGTGHLTHS